MKKLLVAGAIAALAVGLAPATAQVAPPPGVASGTAPPVMSAPHAIPQVRVITDRVMTRDEAVRHVREMFAKLDTNKDGFITRQEVDALRQRMEGAMAMAGDWQKRLADHGIMMGDRGAIFDRLDANHDGSISRQEFVAGHANMVEHRMIVMRRTGSAAAGEPSMPGMNGMHGMRMHGMAGFGAHLFDMADANHDGRVSLEEAETAALAHFDRADLNHDGKLTPEERQQAHQLMRQHRPS